MSSPLSRASVVTALTVLTVTVGLPLTATVAGASVPTPLGVTQTAARNFGNGGPASLALVRATSLVTAADGSVLFFDRGAHEVRRVDATTQVVSVLAGTGVAATGNARCILDGSASATSIPLGDTNGLWTDTAGDVFFWPYNAPGCSPGGDVYRLDAVDGTWHRVLRNPLAGYNLQPSYIGVAVASTGDLFAVDQFHAVIRRISAGSDPNSTGTVFAGTLDTSGSSGDGGPATSATIAPDGPMAVGSDGSLYLITGGQLKVRRVAPDGTVSTIAGSGAHPSNLTSNDGAGQPATNVPMYVMGLTTSADGQTLYVHNRDYTSHGELEALPVAGGTMRVVAGPLGACGSPPKPCVGTAIAEAPVGAGTQLLAADNASIHTWPTDGSTPLASDTRYAGIDDLQSMASPDGVTLDHAFVPGITALATAPSGGLALATGAAIRTLSGVAAESTLGTLAAVHALALSYAGDGTLYAVLQDGYNSPTLASITPSGVITMLVGGGADAASDGALGSSLLLPSAWYSVHLAADLSNGLVYFDTGTAQLFSVDPVTDVVHLVAGAALNGTVPSDLAVGPDHSVFTAGKQGGLLRIAPDATVHVLDCTGGCPGNQTYQGIGVVGLPDGSLAGMGGYGALVRGSDGATSEPVPGLPQGPLTALADGRLVSLSSDSGNGGLLAISDPIPAPSSTDVPAVTVTPGPDQVTVDITPIAGVVQHLQVLGIPAPSDGGNPISSPLIADLTTDGSGTPQHLVFTHLAPGNAYGPGIVHGTTYRFTLVASETDDLTHVSVSNAPQVFDVEPLLDSTPPAAPRLELVNLGTSGRLQVGLPADADIDRVVVRKTEDGTVPATPTDGQDTGATFGYNSPQLLSASIDPLKTTTFTAFAVDTGGNTSAGTTVVRPAAVLASGAAITHIGYLAHSGLEDVVWREGWALGVRYAAGTTPPTTPTSGTGQGQWSGYFGTGVTLPAATGAKVAVSVFNWTDASLTSYRRTSFVLTGRTHSDVLTLTATPTVNPGVRPAVSVLIVRHSPTEGTLALPGQQVSLYRRPVGTSTWAFVAGATTSSLGKAAFTVPVPTGATDYQARYFGLASTPSIAGGNVAVSARTTVRQLITAALSSTSVRHGTAVAVAGTLTAHRVATLYLQRYTGGRWVSVTSVKSASNGSYRLRYVPSTTGYHTLRVYVSATSTLLVGVSPNRVLRVT